IGDLTGVAEGDFLRFEGGQWINDQLALTDITQAMVTQHQAALSINWSQIVGEPSIPADLNDLTDVDLTTTPPGPGDVLTFNGSQWVPEAGGGGGGGASFLGDLQDVDAPYPNPGDVLMWDGYGWVNEQPASTSSGGLQFVDEFVVSGADATDITISGLDLDSDHSYFLQIDLLGASAGTATLSIFFNGDTTAANYERMLVSNGSNA